MIRNPVANIIIPPQALKSANIAGLVKGKICVPNKYNEKNVINCGTATNETTYPTLQAKIAAVKKSKIDFAIKILWSPVIPESSEP